MSVMVHCYFENVSRKQHFQSTLSVGRGSQKSSGVARGGAGGANAPPQIFVVPLLPKTLIGNRQGDMSTMHIITE